MDKDGLVKSPAEYARPHVRLGYRGGSAWRAGLFENPWGPRTDANGTQYKDPERRMEDRSIGLESMTVEEFKRRAQAIIVPA